MKSAFLSVFGTILLFSTGSAQVTLPDLGPIESILGIGYNSTKNREIGCLPAFSYTSSSLGTPCNPFVTNALEGVATNLSLPAQPLACCTKQATGNGQCLETRITQAYQRSGFSCQCVSLDQECTDLNTVCCSLNAKCDPNNGNKCRSVNSQPDCTPSGGATVKFCNNCCGNSCTGVFKSELLGGFGGYNYFCD